MRPSLRDTVQVESSLEAILAFFIFVLVAALALALAYALLKLRREKRRREATERTLTEQYATLRGILDSTKALIFSLDPQYRYTSFNQAHADVMKAIYGAEIEIGRSLIDFMSVAEDRGKATRNIDRALAGEHLVEEAYSGDEYRSRRYFQVSHSPIRAKDGSVIGVAVLSQDITERKRAEDELRRLNRELRAISSCNQLLMRATDEQALLDAICRIMCDDAGYRMAWVGYVDSTPARTVLPVASAGFDDGYLANVHATWADTERGQGPVGIAGRSGKTSCFADFATDPKAAPWREAALRRGYRSSIALPLKDERDIAFGVLSIYSSEPDAFTAEEIHLLEQQAGDLAFGITVLRARAEKKQTERLVQARLRILETAYAGAGNTLENALRVVLDEIEAQTGSEISFYNFLDEDEETLLMRNWSTNTQAKMRAAEGGGRLGISEAGVWGECVRERRPVIHNDYASLPGRKGLPPGHIPVVRELVVPIFRGDRIVAVLGVGNKPTDYDADDIKAATYLGDVSWEIVMRGRAEASVRELTAELERRVVDRTAELAAKNEELEQLNRLFVGREMRMVELKKKIEELEKRTGS